MVLFMLMSWKFNVLLSGEGTAKTMGINVEGLRFVSMLVASVITAACVSFFWASLDLWGLSVPHVTKKLRGQDHRFTIPVSAPVLRGASLELKQGTTLFKNILGINTPADGSIRFNGENLLKMPRRERERRIAYVPQDIHFGALSVLIPSLWVRCLIST